MAIAQLRNDPDSRFWALYWRDRNNRWHEDYEIEPSRNLDDLLSEVQEDPTGVYWG